MTEKGNFFDQMKQNLENNFMKGTKKRKILKN